MRPSWETYQTTSAYDELITPKGTARSAARRIVGLLKKFSETEFAERQAAAELSIQEMGISFTVYSDSGNIDRAWPYDLIPRVIRAKDWKHVSAGLKQRSRALNRFIDDIYNRQKCLADGVLPAELIENSEKFRPVCRGMSPVFGAWAHICGTDLIRDERGRYLVLEDNLRVPSGVSYMVENREITKRVLPELFYDLDIRPVDDYPRQLYSTLASLTPRKLKRPCIAVLTPGIYNSAYFEHAFLAQGMGAELVEGSDLFARDECIFMRTVEGPQRVDVIYRRIDDDFLDPEVFREDSVLGVPGLMAAWKAGNIAIANAPGCGVADDKVIYSFVPDMVRYYLKEEPLINNVKTYLCMREKEKDYVLSNLDKLVVKPANESGGYGIMVGPHSTRAERAACAERIEKDPRNFIAQPTISLSTAPTFCDGAIEPRHVDLRPFILHAKNTWVTPGGLTRVALRKGSLVVNSSQGGGSKDTWVVET